MNITLAHDADSGELEIYFSFGRLIRLWPEDARRLHLLLGAALAAEESRVRYEGITRARNPFHSPSPSS